LVSLNLGLNDFGRNQNGGITICYNYVDVYYNSFITADLNFMEATAPPAQIAKFILRRGDVIVTKDSEAWDDIAIPAYVSSDMHDVLCGYHLAQIRPDPKWADGKYLFRAFCSRGINDQFRVAATGITRYGLGKYWLDNGLFLVPPVEEQCAIAAFLDRETVRIDALMKKKQRQIELLQEKRTALISHAVIKGLDPSAPMKDSEVEWLGQIPAHWKVKKVKFLAKILRGKFSHRPRNDPQLYDGPYPFIQTGDIVSANKYINEYQQTLNELGFAVSKEFPKGTLVMSIAANIGDLAILEFPACFPDSIVGFFPKAQVDLNFLYYNLESMKQELKITAPLNTQQNLNIERIGPLQTVSPPINEQHQIAVFLDQETAKMEGLIAKIQESIDRLKEYRTALISAAVTGQIDVREAAA
jgi:type I restriction enzyme S subunit